MFYNNNFIAIVVASSIPFIFNTSANAGTILSANSDGAAAVLDADLLGISAANLTAPGTVSVVGQPLVTLGTAAAGSTANGAPYDVSSTVLAADVGASAIKVVSLNANKTLTDITVGNIRTQTGAEASLGVGATAISGTAKTAGNSVSGNGRIVGADVGLSTRLYTQIDTTTSTTVATPVFGPIPVTKQVPIIQKTPILGALGLVIGFTDTIVGYTTEVVGTTIGIVGTTLSTVTDIATNLFDTARLRIGLTADALETTTTISSDTAGNLTADHQLNAFVNAKLLITQFVEDVSTLLLGDLIETNTTIDLDTLVYANVGAKPAANVSVAHPLLSSLGLNLVLNEQINNCTGTAPCSATSNAIHLRVDPLTFGLASADVALGHSFAALNETQIVTPPTPPVDDVPEPAALGLFGLGLAGIFAARRRRMAQ